MTKKTGGSSDYYSAEVSNTLDGRPAYTVQSLEVIETLGMTFAEGEAFKAIWRSCAARTLGKHKAGNNALYDAEKVQFYGARMVAAATAGAEAPRAPLWVEHDGKGFPAHLVSKLAYRLHSNGEVSGPHRGYRLGHRSDWDWSEPEACSIVAYRLAEEEHQA